MVKAEDFIAGSSDLDGGLIECPRCGYEIYFSIKLYTLGKLLELANEHIKDKHSGDSNEI